MTEAGTFQHAAHVDHLLSADAFVLGRLQGLRLVPERYEEFPVAGLFDQCHAVKQ